MSCDRIWNKEITNGKQFRTPQAKKKQIKTKMCNKAIQKLYYCNYVQLHYYSKKVGEICNEHTVASRLSTHLFKYASR